MENVGIDRIALDLTSALVKSYGKELTGLPESAAVNVVRRYFEIYDEMKRKLTERPSH